MQQNCVSESPSELAVLFSSPTLPALPACQVLFIPAGGIFRILSPVLRGTAQARAQIRKTVVREGEVSANSGEPIGLILSYNVDHSLDLGGRIRQSRGRIEQLLQGRLDRVGMGPNGGSQSLHKETIHNT